MKEFFGFGGYTREPEGYFSIEHLTFVTALMLIMTALAICFARKYKHRDLKAQNRVLIVAAILIDSLELFKIVITSFVQENALAFLYELPLFLCSIQLITIPLAAFAKGRVREAALDFVCMFGILGAVFGTYFAGQNYACYPVLSFDNVISGVTHSISGFCSLYIAMTGLTKLHRRNIPITLGILSGFCIAAYIANLILDYNYMFLMRGDGTPYDILYNLVGGNPALYAIGVFALFILYITAIYAVHQSVIVHRQAKAAAKEKPAVTV